MTPAYALTDLRVRFGETEILHGLTIDFLDGQMTAIVGPNGAGKSTLMTVLSGVREDYFGSCCFQGKEIRDWRKRDLARQQAFIPQIVRVEFPFTAEQVVFMGRTPYCDGLFESPDDRAAVQQAMETTDCREFAAREFRSLSGGERQRVILASALAQRPAVLLLDEPTTFLDLKHQISAYSLLRRLAGGGVGVLAVTHDLNLAASYADRIVVMSRGQIAADGRPEEVLGPDLLREVFEVEVEVRKGPAGRPLVLYEQEGGQAAGANGVFSNSSW